MLTVNRPGSLITPTYFLSAAHCNNILIPMPPVGNKDKVRQTWSGSKTCRRFVRWDSYMYSLPRLMNTEKSVWGQQKMRAFLRWIVFSPSTMIYFSDTNQHGRTSKVFELQAEVPLAEENSCFWIHCRTSGDKIIPELLSSSLHPYGSRAKRGLGWII